MKSRCTFCGTVEEKESVGKGCPKCLRGIMQPSAEINITSLCGSCAKANRSCLVYSRPTATCDGYLPTDVSPVQPTRS